MPVPSSFSDLDTVANNNSPPGSESAKGNVDNYLRQGFAFSKQLYSATVAPARATVASAATVDLGAQTSPNVTITGTTTITSFGTVADGIVRNVVFSGALTLTHNATSLILPGSANITTAAGDAATFLSLGSGNWKCLKYQSINGYLQASGFTMTGAVNEAKGADIASAATINLTTATGNLVDVTGTTAITAITLAEGATRTVRFTGVLTLTHGSSLVNLGGANITTAAGDFAVFRGYAAGVVRMASYSRASGLPLTGTARPGEIFDWGGSSTPADALFCNGAAVSRTTYAALYAAIGTTWGAGDGSTTFNLPNIPTDYATLQASGNEGTSSTGTVKSHSHVQRIESTSNTSGGLTTRGVTSGGAGDQQSFQSTDPTGGAANLAAGVRVRKCIRF